jgi:hypothetical protein
VAPNPELARLGVTGALRVAALSTTIPTDLTDENQETFIPWQSNSPIRVETTSATETFQATLWETNFDVISLYYRKGLDEMTETGTGADTMVSFTVGGKPKRDLRKFGIDVIDGTYARRIILPYAEVTERGELTYVSNALIGYQVTITAYEGSDGVSTLRMYREGWTLPVVAP